MTTNMQFESISPIKKLRAFLLEKAPEGFSLIRQHQVMLAEEGNFSARGDEEGFYTLKEDSIQGRWWYLSKLDVYCLYETITPGREVISGWGSSLAKAPVLRERSFVHLPNGVWGPEATLVKSRIKK